MWTFPGLLERSVSAVGYEALKLVPIVRWEWQVGGASQLSPDERELLEVINKHLSSVHAAVSSEAGLMSTHSPTHAGTEPGQEA